MSRGEATHETASDRSNGAESERRLGHDPERPLGADENPKQVGALIVGVEGDHGPVRQDNLYGEDVVERHAILQGVRATSVLNDVAANR